MAFTNSPQFNTYKTVDIPFDITDQMRNGNLTSAADGRLINMYYDRVQGTTKEGSIVRVRKRDGIVATPFNMTKANAADVLRGFFYNTDNRALYWAVNNKVYSTVPAASPSIRTVQTLTTSSGPVGFCSYFRSDGVQFVAISDGTDLWMDNWLTSTVTEVTDPDLPSPHIPCPVYIDGYLLLIKSGTQEVYNSDPDDPFAWDPDNFFQAEIHSDTLQKIYKVRNYLVVLGVDSVEFFWDAAKESGSPFERNDSAVHNVGYITGGEMIGDKLYFIGQDKDNGVGVYIIDGFKCERVSNAVIDRQIQAYTLSNYYQNTRATTGVDGYSLSTNGHNFYLVKTSANTWVLDVDDKVWYEWTNTSNTALAVEASWIAYNGMQYLAIAGQTFISVMSPDTYQDFGTNFKTTYITGNNWHDTFNWKIAHRVALKCNQVTSTPVVPVLISWTDDDGLSFSTQQTINLASASPYISRTGKFRRRSYKIEFTDNFPLFLEGLKADLNVLGI